MLQTVFSYFLGCAGIAAFVCAPVGKFSENRIWRRYVGPSALLAGVLYFAVGLAASAVPKLQTLGNAMLLYSGTSIDCGLVHRASDGSIFLSGSLMVEGNRFTRLEHVVAGSNVIYGRDLYQMLTTSCF